MARGRALTSSRAVIGMGDVLTIAEIGSCGGAGGIVCRAAGGRDTLKLREAWRPNRWIAVSTEDSPRT